MNYNFKCVFCRDLGKPDGCPKCGKIKEKVDIRPEEMNIDYREISKNLVPTFYLDNKWNDSNLREDYQDYIGDPHFERYLSQLNDVYNHLKNGGIVKNSVLVTSPMGYGKTTWVYNCILELKKHGYNVAPLINTNELKCMMQLHHEQPTWQNRHKDFTYGEYINSDVLFLSVSKGDDYVYAPKTIIEILDTRSQLSLPTIIISNWSEFKLCKADATGMFKRLISTGSRRDNCKYLTTVTFTETKRLEV